MRWGNVTLIQTTTGQKKKKKSPPRTNGGVNAIKWDREKHAKINRVQKEPEEKIKKGDKKPWKRSHPKTLAPANDQLQSRPATVYEDEVKM